MADNELERVREEEGREGEEGEGKVKLDGKRRPTFTISSDH